MVKLNFTTREYGSDEIESVSSNFSLTGTLMLCPKCNKIINTKGKNIDDWVKEKTIGFKPTVKRVLSCGCKVTVREILESRFVDEWLANSVSNFISKGYNVIDARAPHLDGSDGYIKIDWSYLNYPKELIGVIVGKTDEFFPFMRLEKWEYNPVTDNNLEGTIWVMEGALPINRYWKLEKSLKMKVKEVWSVEQGKFVKPTLPIKHIVLRTTKITKTKFKSPSYKIQVMVDALDEIVNKLKK